MVFLICERHNKIEKSGSNVMTSAHICMERECGESYKVLCQVCKKEHKSHAITLLNIEDVSFLLERLIKLPFKAMAKPFGQALNIIQQLKFIKEFRKKIDLLQKEIQRQSVDLIDKTQTLMRQYTKCQVNATTLSLLFDEIDQQSKYQQFTSNCTHLMATLQYNVKKDKLQYGNPFILQTEEQRIKIMQSVKNKIEEVRDYSMKIIEVILNNYESQDENQDINYQQKHYDVLKEQLLLENSKLSKNSVASSRTTVNRSELINNHHQTHEKQLQTDEQLSSFEEMQEKINNILEQKQNLSQELLKLKQRYAQKQKLINKLQLQMRGNRHFRNEKFKIKQDLVNKIIQIWNEKGSDCEDTHI